MEDIGKQRSGIKENQFEEALEKGNGLKKLPDYSQRGSRRLSIRRGILKIGNNRENPNTQKGRRKE